MKRNRKPILNKERFIMLSASIFVLAALTMTGIYVRNMNQEKAEEENRIDLSQLKENVPESAKNEDSQEGNLQSVNTKEGILAEIPGVNTEAQQKLSEEQANAVKAEALPKASNENPIKKPETTPEPAENDEDAQAEAEPETQSVSGQPADDLDADPYFFEGVSADVSPEPVVVYQPHFEQGEQLLWPLAGEVIIGYSMDQVVWFSTLKQYRYNPAVIIGAAVGTPITASADGSVLSVTHDDQLGNTLVLDIGDGYQVTYGQLKDVAVAAGSVVNAGDIIGYVAEPTIFYTLEGSNLYLEVTRDGLPINPVELLQTNAGE